MSLDPAPLASSILSFIETANKLKVSFSKINNNKRRLRNAMTEAIRSLVGLESSIRTRYSLLGESECREVVEILEDAQRAILDVQPRLDRYAAEEPRGPVFTALANAKAWFHRNAIEAETQQLEMIIRSCQMRFLVIMSVHKEHSIVVNHQEYLDRLEHFEELVSYMLVRESETDGGHPFLVIEREPAEIDLQFLHRQVKRIAVTTNERHHSWSATMKSNPAPLDLIGMTTFTKVFPSTLRLSLSILQELNDGDHTTPPRNFLNSILVISSALVGIERLPTASLLLSTASQMFHLLGDGHISPLYQRASALTQSHSAIVAHSTNDPMALSLSEQAVAAWHRIYDEHGEAMDLLNFIWTITIYDTQLFRRGRLEESLDCSQQVLLLIRSVPVVEVDDTRAQKK
ncbi:hypothetical protein HGRIS_014917 [Hohenbuehelia grisea]|uniref:Uncharacterized protein n=1 Tax=Hohenbuehelia grisea TaxID=104357 RepID=A0ABR3JNS1_9AGAR